MGFIAEYERNRSPLTSRESICLSCSESLQNHQDNLDTTAGSPTENGCFGMYFHVMIWKMISKYGNEVLPDEKKL